MFHNEGSLVIMRLNFEEETLMQEVISLIAADASCCIDISGVMRLEGSFQREICMQYSPDQRSFRIQVVSAHLIPL